MMPTALIQLALTGSLGMSDVTAAGPMLPLWFVTPLCGLTLVLIFLHMRRLAREEMPESRRRIRSASGLLLLLLPVLMCYALGVSSPREPVVFVGAWTAVAMLVLLLLVLAVADIGNTLLMYRSHARRMRAEMRELRAGLSLGAAIRDLQTAVPDARLRTTPSTVPPSADRSERHE